MTLAFVLLAWVALSTILCLALAAAAGRSTPGVAIDAGTSQVGPVSQPPPAARPIQEGPRVRPILETTPA